MVALDLVLSAIATFEMLAMTTSMYMFYIYVIKPRWKHKNIRDQILPKGITVITDMHIYQDGTYSGTWTNFNMTRFVDDVVAKITGALPKRDVDGLIKQQVDNMVYERVEGILANNADNPLLNKYIGEKMNKYLNEMLNKKE